jgi:uncharacterized membrane protein
MIRDRRGSITVYTALFLAAGISAGTLAIDVGRMTVLRSEMQNRADSAAMAGAVQLDGRAGARGRWPWLPTRPPNGALYRRAAAI